MTVTADAVASAGSIDQLDTGSAPARRRLPSSCSILLAATVTFGIFLRLLPTLRGAPLTGVREYDDGVHYAAGLALVHARLPYRDFVLLHPPGVALLMAPVAALGNVIGEPGAMAMARLLMLGVATANMTLIAALTRRHGRAAAAVATATYAVWSGAVVAERTVMLEPFVNLFCLLGLPALRRRRPATAGFLVAAAVCVKLFALTMLIALAAVALWHGVGRRFATGVVVGVAVIAGPFFAVAPAAMWHDVVVVQATRPAAGVIGPGARWVAATPALWTANSGAAASLLVIGGCAALAARQRSSWPWLAMLMTTTLGFLLGSSFFVHYSGYLALPVVLTLAHGLSGDGAPVRLLTVAAAAICLAAGVHAVMTPHPTYRTTPAVTLPVGCVWSENPSLLITLNRLAPPTTACPQQVDPRGAVLAALRSSRGRFYPDGFRGVPTAQRRIHEELQQADLIVLDGPLSADPLLDADNQHLVEQQFHKTVFTRAFSVWERSQPRTAPVQKTFPLDDEPDQVDR